jgi:predicted  nucleic acid-binding Zn-ribbon protein
MKIPSVQLRALHHLLKLRQDLRNQLERGPRQIAAKAAMVATAAAGVEAAKLRLRELKMSSDRMQLQLRDRENKLVGLETKMNQAASNREYQTLKEQIAADKQANNVLSDEILETMEQIDTALKGVAEAEAKLKTIQAEEVVFKQQVNTRLEIVKVDLQRVSDEYKAAESKLPEEFMSEYIRLVNARNEEAMAGIENNTCGGCYHVLTPKVVDRLTLEQVVFCPSCGVLLYRG